MIRKERLASRYAMAFFEMVKEKGIEENEKGMALISSTINKEPKILKLLSNPAIPLSEKGDIFKNLFSPPKELFMLIFLLLRKRRLKLLPIILIYFNKLIDKERESLRVILTCVFPPKEDLKKRLIEKLKGILKKDIVLNVKIDKNIIGGGILQIGSKRIDGSIQGFLKRMEVMLGGEKNL